MVRLRCGQAGTLTHCSVLVCCQWCLVKSSPITSPTPDPPTVHAESLVYQCYVQQMERLQHHFPPNQGVSEKLANLRALVEVRALSALIVLNIHVPLVTCVSMVCCCALVGS